MFCSTIILHFKSFFLFSECSFKKQQNTYCMFIRSSLSSESLESFSVFSETFVLSHSFVLLCGRLFHVRALLLLVLTPGGGGRGRGRPEKAKGRVRAVGRTPSEVLSGMTGREAGIVGGPQM